MLENRIFLIAIAPVLIFLAILFFLSDACRAVQIDEHIYIVPTGNVDNKIIRNLKEALPSFLPMNTNATLDPRVELPQSAYNPSRNQYNAQNVLEEIHKYITVDVRNERVIIVTDVDLYVPDSDFVFGFADAKKGVCIISLARLGNIERTLKEAACELGRSWGLGLCSNPKCVMFPSASIADIDKKRNMFCNDCQNKLHNRYYKPLINVKL